MSIVSSYFSVRSTALGINPQVASFMDSVFAIGFGLAVRFVIDAVSRHDQKVTGTLVGLWEGIVMQHFLRKMPTSSDPYVAYGVRLFIDFLFTESLARLVLVLIWTGMGVIFADIAPALWIDAGLRRFWRRFRRDLYVMSRSISSVPYPRTRTVRFSPSQTASVISSVPPSVFTTYTQDPTLLSVPTPALRQRHVPGAFPGDVSETETDIGSVLGLRDVLSESSTTPGPSQRRLTSRMRSEHDFETETDISSDMNDLDEENLSSSASSVSTETPDPSAMNPSEIPDYDEEEQVVTTEKKPEESDRELTPKQNNITLPPTPSDSFAIHLLDEPDGVQPPPEVPVMPDEEINKREASPIPLLVSKDLPPTPPLGISTILPPPQHIRPPHDVQPTTFTQSSSQEDSTSQPKGALIDFTDESPTSSQQQQQQQQSPSDPPPRFSAAYDNNFIYRPSGSPPPPFQDTYGQGDPKWNDSTATITPSNQATSNSNNDPPNKMNQQNNTGDTNNENVTVADAGAEQPQGGKDQAQAESSTAPQTALNKGKAKDTNGNDGNGAANKQRNSRSGRNTPRPGSKTPSGDEDGDLKDAKPKVQKGKGAQSTPTALGNRPSPTGGNGKNGDKGVSVGGADNTIPKTGSETQHDPLAQSTTAAWAEHSSIPGDNGKARDSAANTTGDNAKQQAESAQDKPEATSGLTEAGQGAGSSQSQTGDSHAEVTDPSRDNVDKDKADNTDVSRANPPAERSSQNEQAEAGPSTIPKPDSTPPPSPSTSEQSNLPETSSGRLTEALQLRKDVIALDQKIAKLKSQHTGAAFRGVDQETVVRKANFDAAVQEKEKMAEKIRRRLAGAFSEYSSLMSQLTIHQQRTVRTPGLRLICPML
jgi:hypothetical protein